jgi:hypothetical protein
MGGGEISLAAAYQQIRPFVCMKRREIVGVRVLFLLHSSLEAPEEFTSNHHHLMNYDDFIIANA